VDGEEETEEEVVEQEVHEDDETFAFFNMVL